MTITKWLQPASSAQDQQEQRGADQCLDDLRHDPGPNTDSQDAEQPAADDGAQNADDNSADQSGP